MGLKTIKEINERYIIFFDNGKNATAIATDIEEAIQLEKELHPKWNIISASLVWVKNQLLKWIGH